LNNPAGSPGILFILSAPSGAGKSTLLAALRESVDFAYSISCTTRGPRTGEVDGRDYHFVTEAEFSRREAEGEFLEHAKVHGHRYGTPLGPVVETLQAGHDMLLDIDIAGAAQVRQCGHPVIREALCDIFLMPPSLQELRRRLEHRATEPEEQIALRLRNAHREMEAWKAYKYTLLSRSREEDPQLFRAIMEAEHALSRRQRIELEPEEV